MTADQTDIMEFEYAPEDPLAVYQTPVVMVGGGDVDLERLNILGRKYPIIAVDSGANAIHDAGLEAGLLVGDFDSVRPSGRDHIRRQIRIREQYSTDFEKALKIVDAPKIFAFGFLGKRFDHSLGALHALAANTISHGDQRDIILLDSHDVVVMRQHIFQKTLPQGIRLSLWSMLPQRFTKTKGLVWPMDGLEVGTGFNLALCNQVIIPPEETAGDIDVEAHADNDAPFAVLMAPEAWTYFLD